MPPGPHADFAAAGHEPLGEDGPLAGTVDRPGLQDKAVWLVQHTADDGSWAVDAERADEVGPGRLQVEVDAQHTASSQVQALISLPSDDGMEVEPADVQGIP